VCAMNESRLDTHAYPPEVTLQIDQEDEDSYSRAAASINAHAAETIVIVQHEYGIYGGDSGSLLVGFLEKLRCPVITTLHTVVAEPSYEMRAVTEQIIANSDRLITLTDTSYKLFASLYPSAQEKLVRIMHGIHPLLYKQPKAKKAQFGLADRSVLLTFGLLSRNKGIEYIISALPSIKEKIPNVMYLVLGATHPGVLRQEGEAYRLELMGLVKSLSLEGNVRFVDDFLPVKEILEYLQATDVYVATSLDPQQAVSGTLSYALGAGRAVIATNFAQAKEIVSQHVGRIVSIRDSGAVSEAAIELFAAPDKMQSMNHAAFAQTRSMLWTNVADDYAKCLADVARINEMRVAIWPPLKWDHLLALTDEFGMYQFS
jgi:glycosyltransferase involved in cell wall biosynthesis